MLKNIFINKLFYGLLLALFSFSVMAEISVYSIRVDGLACPYCAYGIEKKLNELPGIKFIDMDLNKGLVKVEAYDARLEDEQLKHLFEDAGFTYRSKQVTVK